MEQDYLNLPKEDESEQKNAQLKRFEPHIAIFILQGVVCVIVLLACLITKTFFGDFFGEIKNFYDENLNEDTSPSLVLESDAEPTGVGGPLEVSAVNISGGFQNPLPSGTLTSGYGYRIDPFTNKTSFHSGLDIAASKGTPIKSALSGVVELSQKSGGDYGNYIIVNHGAFKTLYAHCEKLTVSEGDFVSAGDIIATVGSTGRSTGPHLHFELRIGNGKIDPTPFIKLENK
ncbi:MAG: M23 family metallopeptidase [Clostridia bacterium]|nr:M23 family metallopeptidase [Clostridia bacterium]